jgi:hypothetical protein
MKKKQCVTNKNRYYTQTMIAVVPDGSVMETVDRQGKNLHSNN